jgi:tetratricopeptide (TPR) repeat protein
MSFQRIWKVGLCIPLVAVGALHPRVARAAPPTKEPATRRPKEFQRYLQAALRLYNSLDYEQALEKLTRARSYVRTLEDDALLSFYEGIILADLNRKVESRAAFRAGLLLQPDARLPLKVSPKVEQDFEKVRADVRRELASQQDPAETEQQPPRPQQAGSVPSPSGLDSGPLVPTPGVTASFTPRSPVVSYGLMGGGAALAGAGVFLGMTALTYNERKRSMTIGEAVQARATASTQLSAGSFLLGAGLATIGTGTVLLLLSGNQFGGPPASARTSLVLTPMPGGFALGSTGSF